MDDGELVLPSAGPDPISLDVALAAVLGYARGRRPLFFRAPNVRTGRWVEIPAFGYARFDARPRGQGPLGEPDVLTAEGLHGRLDPGAWAQVKQALQDAGPILDGAAERAAGRALWELPDDEFSVLAEPGTVGAFLRQVEDPHVAAALHHRRPELVPLLARATRWQLLPHVREGDSGPPAVIFRELRANAAAFTRLEAELASEDVPLTRLRLHDVLLWLTATLRLPSAVALGRR
ncbi:hypothetical protein [Blastococcus sp. LR1]|uniref:hypothetical protein n=1 Tax=Blastococcus sp. LR1 TaxID=2877000 RepID=UPI001CCC97D5|nr:hypothetical protein [Blastococcus sp. LR1]MCA0146747.1 hypothetical protein [Blastococcus sp. LR1]